MPFHIKIATTFSAAHAIDGISEACSRMHGYSYRVTATLCVATLPSSGHVGDAYAWLEALERAIDPLKHQCLNNLEAFLHTPPTMEQLAIWIHDALAQKLKVIAPDAAIHSISLSNQMGLDITYLPENA